MKCYACYLAAQGKQPAGTYETTRYIHTCDSARTEGTYQTSRELKPDYREEKNR